MARRIDSLDGSAGYDTMHTRLQLLSGKVTQGVAYVADRVTWYRLGFKPQSAAR